LEGRILIITNNPMTKKDEQYKDYIEGLFVKFTQSTIQQNSALAGDYKTFLKVLDQKVSDYIINDNKWKEEQGINIKKNTEFRLQTTGGMSTLKWLAGSGFVGGAISIILNILP